MISTLLVANRGEIARRVIRGARTLGIRTVAIYSEPDADAPHVAEADRAVALRGSTATETYLDVAQVLAAARATGADAVHPGYGFLSENAGFARACAGAGLTWVGPDPASIEAMGVKHTAKALAREAGVPTLPDALLDSDDRRRLGARRRGRRLPVAGEGLERRWWRQRDARGPGRGGVGRRRPLRPRRGRAQLRRRHGVPRAPARRAPTHRDPGRRRHARPRRPSRRARVLDPAPAPEGRRGGAVARRVAGAARTDGQHRRRAGGEARLRGRRDRGVPRRRCGRRFRGQAGSRGAELPEGSTSSR